MPGGGPQDVRASASREDAMLPNECGEGNDSVSWAGKHFGDPLQVVLAVKESPLGFMDLDINFDASGLCGGSESGLPESVLSEAEASEW
mmetsp:Transcript_86331/g.155501  ORF Transcript_86331/g.155501 Transcript_86331/m.155501 type:complete len:89 (-) Transcript_86331:106-372(-)